MVEFTLNVDKVGSGSDADTPLLWVIRDELNMKGTKFGCGIAKCGACTVHIDGTAMRSCVTAISAVAGKSITTIEGLDPDGQHALLKAWVAEQVPQCGCCQSGQIMQAASLGVGTALVMGFGSLAGCGRDPAVVETASEQLSNKMFSPSVWFEMTTAGDILVNIAKAVMGQHVGTALARVVADELCADWSKVSIKHVNTDPKWGYTIMGGSWSVFTSFKAMSQAGTAGRQVLLEAGAEMLGVSAADCVASDSKVDRWVEPLGQIG